VHIVKLDIDEQNFTTKFVDNQSEIKSLSNLLAKAMIVEACSVFSLSNFCNKVVNHVFIQTILSLMYDILVYVTLILVVCRVYPV